MELQVNVDSPALTYEMDKVRQFFQGSFNRMLVSYHKYGDFRTLFPHLKSGAHNAKYRLNKYQETGNTEFLMDAFAYILIEWLRPSVENAHFRATDSDESPGSLYVDGTKDPGKGA